MNGADLTREMVAAGMTLKQLARETGISEPRLRVLMIKEDRLRFSLENKIDAALFKLKFDAINTK